LILWISSQFSGQVLLEESFGLAVTFTSLISSDTFVVTNVYGPCEGIARQNFVAWLFSLNIGQEDLWLILGDLNFYHFVENRKRDGENMTDIATFNEIISYLGLIELPIKDVLSLGVICRWILCLSNLTGSSPQRFGL
jgi:hypothetical protein